MMGALAAGMLAEGLVDCIASDNHGDARTLGYARRWLEERGGSEQARLLTHTNAARLLADEPTLPVAPLPLPTGVLTRLKRALLGGR